MHKQRCGIAALTTAALVAGATAQALPARAAVAPAPAALAYVANGQVAVIESGNLTVAGTGQNPVWAPNGSKLLFDAPDLLSSNAVIYVADQHGAGAKVVVSHAYPAINPTWSPDSNSVVYTAVAPNTKPKGQTIQLEVKTLRVSTGATASLGTFTFTTGCITKFSALQDTFSRAQGSYLGVPSTLIWAQPSLVVVQSSCTGIGLTSFKSGGGSPQTIKGWSGGVLSPDGKTIVASAGSGKIGLLTVASRATKSLSVKFSPGSFAWHQKSKTIFAVGEPADPAVGSVSIYAFTVDGKTVTTLGTVRAAGAFHLSLNQTGDHLAMSLVASAPAKSAAPPSTTVYDLGAVFPGSPSPIIGGSQPAWRP